MKQTIEISSSEWEIMRVVWAHQPISGREIIDHLTRSFPWKEGTIKSMISRLTKKGMLIKDNTTSPILLKASLSQEEANQFRLEQVFSNICQKKQAEALIYLLNKIPADKEDTQKMLKIIEEKHSDAPHEIKCNCKPGQCACQGGN